jgi:hypothetical protein
MRFLKRRAGFQSANCFTGSLTEIADWEPALQTPLAGYSI